MEQLIVLIVFGGIALVNWLLKQGGAKLQDTLQKNREELQRQQSANPPPRSDAADSEDERMRKFFEALGLPPGSTPPAGTKRPPQLPARPAIPRRPTFEPHPELARRTREIAEAFSVPMTKGDLRREQRAQPAPPPLPAASPRQTPAILMPTAFATASEQPVFAAAEAVAASARATEQFPAASAPVSASTQSDDLFAMLRSPEQIRNAIVLREILGLPRGLQSGLEQNTFPLP